MRQVEAAVPRSVFRPLGHATYALGVDKKMQVACRRCSGVWERGPTEPCPGAPK
jgi:hypothetical protein